MWTNNGERRTNRSIDLQREFFLRDAKSERAETTRHASVVVNGGKRMKWCAGWVEAQRIVSRFVGHCRTATRQKTFILRALKRPWRKGIGETAGVPATDAATRYFDPLNERNFPGLCKFLPARIFIPVLENKFRFGRVPDLCRRSCDPRKENHS